MIINEKKIEADFPLVSIVVATYNSAKTVIETLESIKAQTYDNIELIVSDDCSQDNTIDVVSRWIDGNGTRFVHVELVVAEKNTGVSGNFHRGIMRSKGNWIKSIAGDDQLIPTAIEEYISFIKANTENVRMCISDVECFSTNGDVDKKEIENYKIFFEKESETYLQQKKRVIYELVFVGPTYFYSRELYNEIGGFKEKYGCAEEWPFVYEVIMRGNRIYEIDKKLVRYRVESGTLCRSHDTQGLPNKRYFDGVYKFFFDTRLYGLIRAGHPLTAWHSALWLWSIKCKYHIKNETMQMLVKRILMMFSPLSYFQKLKYH